MHVNIVEYETFDLLIFGLLSHTADLLQLVCRRPSSIVRLALIYVIYMFTFLKLTRPIITILGLEHL